MFCEVALAKKQTTGYCFLFRLWSVFASKALFLFQTKLFSRFAPVRFRILHPQLMKLRSVAKTRLAAKVTRCANGNFPGVAEEIKRIYHGRDPTAVLKVLLFLHLIQIFKVHFHNILQNNLSKSIYKLTIFLKIFMFKIQ